ncbi:hypothetical protein PICMEDRAFT_74965 [Pichia membranifaciens NRRL Y-2026]|uniref:Amidase domain-containing protein n=1 Tax=Pichia membranifaciens NRRL Y-2026 TaxID=763406 RepID=A0A1E3NDD1_9ASCO|nr:hypothetical protein PICMEDRAFT_74965 [Pichia membranifaciens NRRL Y-2026]ODQ44129.1 hypothetical protein PICMEDRAFT_74965 [Pichia membranifaciens NRRL Y-2026]
MTVSAGWKELAEQKKKAVDALIPEEWTLPKEVLDKYDATSTESVLNVPEKFLSKKEYDITEHYTVKELLEKLQTGAFSATDVVKAFSHRAAIATQLTNCCTELMFEYGAERAKFLDEYLEKHKKPFGPLHGLPISLKDSFNIPGFDSTLGFVSKIGNKAGFDTVGDFARLLSDLGAVFYVKTNIPQTLMTGDSENNIFGRTLNPSNLSWTAGGSSGGEGALIKMRGSLLGIGTDIAGSIRIPALCNGVYGFRPTAMRFPMGNQTDPSRECFVGVLATAGPLASDFESIQLLVKETLDQKPWNYDAECLRLRYQVPEIDNKSKLKIGVIYEDPDLPVHPPVKRIIGEAAKILEKEGHSVQKITSFPSYDDAWALAWSLFQSDPKSTAWENLMSTGERIIDSLLLPGLEVYGKPPQDIAELIELKERVKVMTEKWLEIFKNYDVIIAPGSPSTAPPHDEYGIAPYTCAWNVVDFPAACIPFGKADASIDLDDGAQYPEKLEKIYTHYRPEAFDGGIGSVQVIAPHLEDEKLLACCAIIDKALNKK